MWNCEWMLMVGIMLSYISPSLALSVRGGNVRGREAAHLESDVHSLTGKDVSLVETNGADNMEKMQVADPSSVHAPDVSFLETNGADNLEKMQIADPSSVHAPDVSFLETKGDESRPLALQIETNSELKYLGTVSFLQGNEKAGLVGTVESWSNWLFCCPDWSPEKKRKFCILLAKAGLLGGGVTAAVIAGFSTLTYTGIVIYDDKYPNCAPCYLSEVCPYSPLLNMSST